MNNNEKFKEIMDKTKILKPVKNTIFTFCPTDVQYYLVTELLNKQLVEIRKGKVKVEKPLILQPAYLADIALEGFDTTEMGEIKKFIESQGLRGLQYKYKNETENVNLISGILESVVDKISQDIDNDEGSRATIIQGIPEMWGISLMKGITEVILKSFPENMKELEERGWFNK